MNVLEAAIERQLTDLEENADAVRSSAAGGNRDHALSVAEKSLEALATMERGLTCFLDTQMEPLNWMRRDLLEGLRALGDKNPDLSAGAVENAVHHVRELLGTERS
jgi:hypothetical protein